MGFMVAGPHGRRMPHTVRGWVLTVLVIVGVLILVLLAVVIANYVTQDGESTWFEGVQLLAVYVVLGLAFYFA